jgi:cupin 2 domain-containing protein
MISASTTSSNKQYILLAGSICKVEPAKDCSHNVSGKAKMISKKNIFNDIPTELPDELFEEILTGKTFKMERIVSRGHFSPEGFWSDQDENEWVILLQGSAGLRFSGKEELVVLRPGDCVRIPRHKRHRVEWTDPEQETVWLAVYYK